LQGKSRISSRKAEQKNNVSIGEEKNILGNITLTDEEKEKIKSSNKQIDEILDAMRRQIAEQTKQKTKSDQEKVIEIINKHNGQVGQTSVLANAIGAVINPEALQDLAKSPLIESITPDYEYVFDLDDSACMLGASSWWNAGYDGGTYDAALLDSGVSRIIPIFYIEIRPLLTPRNNQEVS